METKKAVIDGKEEDVVITIDEEDKNDYFIYDDDLEDTMVLEIEDSHE